MITSDLYRSSQKSSHQLRHVVLILRTVELGRFGRFPARLLVGQQDGMYFRLTVDDSITLMTTEEMEGAVNISEVTTVGVPEVTATNQTLHDTNTSQRLTTEDIESLKLQVITGDMDAREMVERVVRSSETFERKNEFSQIKYVQRKQKKFLRWFALRMPSVRTLSQHFMKRDPRKIMDLRLDVLSQVICLGNVQGDQGKCLIWDETFGFLSGVLLLKTSETTQIVHVHPDRQMQVPMIIHFNLTEQQRLRLHSMSLLRGDEEDVFYESPGTDPDRLAIQRRRFEERKKRRDLLRSWTMTSAFDSLVITVGRTDPIELISRLGGWLRPSAKLVVYSSWRELLLPAYMELRKSDEYIDVAISESWLRPYQSAPGRIHPAMTCNGHAGTILSATKIVTTPRPVK